MRDRSFRQGATSWLDDLIFRVRARAVMAQLPHPPSAVADLGSGYDARFLRYARRTGRIAAGIAVDLSLDTTRPDPSIQLIVADLSSALPIPSASIAATTSLAVLEHLEQPMMHVDEIHRILGPGGVLIMTTPSVRAQPILELLAFRLKVIDADEIRDHKHYYTKQELVSILVRAGFSSDSISYRSFTLGMNQLVVAKKSTALSSDTHVSSGVAEGMRDA